MLRRAVAYANVHDDPEFWNPVIRALRLGAQDANDPRGMARCAQVLSTIRSQNMGALEYLDKAERLDAGSPTEIVDTPMVVTFDRRG